MFGPGTPPQECRWLPQLQCHEYEVFWGTRCATRQPDTIRCFSHGKTTERRHEIVTAAMAGLNRSGYQRGSQNERALTQVVRTMSDRLTEFYLSYFDIYDRELQVVAGGNRNEFGIVAIRDIDRKNTQEIGAGTVTPGLCPLDVVPYTLTKLVPPVGKGTRIGRSISFNVRADLADSLRRELQRRPPGPDAAFRTVYAHLHQGGTDSDSAKFFATLESERFTRTEFSIRRTIRGLSRSSGKITIIDLQQGRYLAKQIEKHFTVRAAGDQDIANEIWGLYQRLAVA